MEFLALLIAFAVISRILEAIGGGAKKGPGTRPPRPAPRLPRQERAELPGEVGTETSPASAHPQDAAAEMIPDELWELLTGQKRPRPAPPPAPPAPQAPPSRSPERAAPSRASRFPTTARRPALDEEVEFPRELRDEEAEAAEFVKSHRRDVQGDIEKVLEQQRTVLVRRAPDQVSKVVSLETEPLPERERHRRFHEKVDRPAPRIEAVPATAVRLGLKTPADLRRAFILREVLGPPRSLEEDPHQG